MIKNNLFIFFVLAMSLLSLPVFSQAEKDSTLLGLPGDNLDLYAVLDLFQKSKTIEDFEKTLNLEKTGVNNLDLDLDNKVDFIKVVTKQDGDDFTFVLQVAVTEKETQDVAVILVSKDKDKKITMQIVGDVDLYGKDYIVEPKTSVTPATTANPGYTGADPVTVSVPATTTTVIVESAPIVQYVYSPAYVPYYPPYYYGYYPPYFAAFSVMAVGIYAVNHSYYHHGGYGYHGNTTVIHNTNNFNNYNNSRNTSNTVNNNRTNGNYRIMHRPPSVRSLCINPSVRSLCINTSVRELLHRHVSHRELLHRHVSQPGLRHLPVSQEDLLHQHVLQHQHRTGHHQQTDLHHLHPDQIIPLHLHQDQWDHPVHIAVEAELQEVEAEVVAEDDNRLHSVFSL